MLALIIFLRFIEAVDKIKRTVKINLVAEIIYPKPQVRLKSLVHLVKIVQVGDVQAESVFFCAQNEVRQKNAKQKKAEFLHFIFRKNAAPTCTNFERWEFCAEGTARIFVI